ncbi:SLAC1 anion channel family protein [Deinococcus roseus]|uniref:Transporter n=1 Tax=Deinococcus roseus TaxID=392414 RepID=A0ABQ2DB06_9DEIO|nr:SLAC1 anion channel family protein [Deinococcus roseus]GGJ49575.1 transporter [Deinococcus roseus]
MERIREPQSILKHVPIPIFASVMGISGLGLTWRSLSQTYSVFTAPAEGVLIAGGLVFAGVGAIYVSKILLHPDAVKQDLLHPVRHGFAGQVPISLLLLAEAALPSSQILAGILAGAGTVLTAALTATTWVRWSRTGFSLEHLSPIWVVPPIACLMVPLLGVRLGWTETSWFFFSAGLLQWLVLLPLIVQRTLLNPAGPVFLQPLQAILMAPPAVAFLAHVALTGKLQEVDRILVYASLLFAVWVLPGLPAVIRTPFNWTWWAYAMPMAAVLLALQEYAHLSGVMALHWVGLAGGVLLAFLVGLLAFHSISGLLKGTLFQPE